MQICNACRYAKGTAQYSGDDAQLEFTPAESHYLFNLATTAARVCKRASTPPHEFGVNVPRAMRGLRARTYRDYAWPKAFGALYDRSGWCRALRWPWGGVLPPMRSR